MELPMSSIIANGQIIRDNYIGRPFFDATASEFVLDLEKWSKC